MFSLRWRYQLSCFPVRQGINLVFKLLKNDGCTHFLIQTLTRDKNCAEGRFCCSQMARRTMLTHQLSGGIPYNKSVIADTVNPSQISNTVDFCFILFIHFSGVGVGMGVCILQNVTKDVETRRQPGIDIQHKYLAQAIKSVGGYLAVVLLVRC